MDNFFTHKLALITIDGKCSPYITGIMRKDETAAIILPKHEFELGIACKLRYYKTTFELSDYVIKSYHHDIQRPLGKWLIKPIVIQLFKLPDDYGVT